MPHFFSTMNKMELLPLRKKSNPVFIDSDDPASLSIAEDAFAGVAGFGDLGQRTARPSPELIEEERVAREAQLQVALQAAPLYTISGKKMAKLRAGRGIRPPPTSQKIVPGAGLTPEEQIIFSQQAEAVAIAMAGAKKPKTTLITDTWGLPKGMTPTQAVVEGWTYHYGVGRQHNYWKAPRRMIQTGIPRLSGFSAMTPWGGWQPMPIPGFPDWDFTAFAVGQAGGNPIMVKDLNNPAIASSFESGGIIQKSAGYHARIAQEQQLALGREQQRLRDEAVQKQIADEQAQRYADDQKREEEAKRREQVIADEARIETAKVATEANRQLEDEKRRRILADEATAAYQAQLHQLTDQQAKDEADRMKKSEEQEEAAEQAKRQKVIDDETARQQAVINAEATRQQQANADFEKRQAEFEKKQKEDADKAASLIADLEKRKVELETAPPKAITPPTPPTAVTPTAVTPTADEKNEILETITSNLISQGMPENQAKPLAQSITNKYDLLLAGGMSETDAMNQAVSEGISAGVTTAGGIPVPADNMTTYYLIGGGVLALLAGIVLLKGKKQPTIVVAK